MRAIYITSDNHRRLDELLIAARSQPDPRDREVLQGLKHELARARVVPAVEIPPEVVTMHSQARLLDMDTGEEMVYRLVFPGEANIETGQISVLAPLGTAMLGYRAGDSFRWTVPAGVRRLKILEVIYQPEANGQCSTGGLAHA